MPDHELGVRPRRKPDEHPGNFQAHARSRSKILSSSATTIPDPCARGPARTTSAAMAGTTSARDRQAADPGSAPHRYSSASDSHRPHTPSPPKHTPRVPQARCGICRRASAIWTPASSACSPAPAWPLFRSRRHRAKQQRAMNGPHPHSSATGGHVRRMLPWGAGTGCQSVVRATMAGLDLGRAALTSRSEVLVCRR